MTTKVDSQKKLRLSCTGYELREMFSVATRWLEKNASAINDLNVFPVPDGDTGTNMLQTMRATIEGAARPLDNIASDVAQAMAHGALMGARGNSGVILSQILRGIAEGLDGVVSLGPKEMAQALDKASVLAYQGIIKPKEGTMLTVIKDVAAAARNSVIKNNNDLISLMEVVVQEAKKSVERTPELLDILKEAGVVDAGGQGIYVILEGILHYLRGEVERIELLETESPPILQPAPIAAKSLQKEEEIFGYCTEFIIKGNKLNHDWIRKMIEAKGDSIVVVGDDTMTKIHIHTPHPGTIIEFGISLGSLHDLKIQNMDAQHEEFLEMRRAPISDNSIAVVSVVVGAGLEGVFRSLGASGIIPGGQTMNPSTQEILRAIESVPSDKVIVLPNNKNVVLTAKKAASLSKKKVLVLPTQSVPQGIAALLAFNCEMEMESNLSEMAKAQQRVKSVEVTKAVREAKLGKLRIKAGEFIGLIDGKLKAANANLRQAVTSTLKAAEVKKAEIISLYYGCDIVGEEAESLGRTLQAQHPHLQVEVIEGGQPHYSYVVSVE
jgi:DAK2 domain fusion protein YloV